MTTSTGGLDRLPHATFASAFRATPLGAFDDALCLAERALDGAGLDHAHRRRHADELFDVAAQELALRLAGAGVREIFPGLDQHTHGIEPAFARHLDLVMRRKPGAAQDLLLDLRRMAQ